MRGPVKFSTFLQPGQDYVQTLRQTLRLLQTFALKLPETVDFLLTFSDLHHGAEENMLSFWTIPCLPWRPAIAKLPLGEKRELSPCLAQYHSQICDLLKVVKQWPPLLLLKILEVLDVVFACSWNCGCSCNTINGQSFRKDYSTLKTETYLHNQNSTKESVLSAALHMLVLPISSPGSSGDHQGSI